MTPARTLKNSVPAHLPVLDILTDMDALLEAAVGLLVVVVVVIVVGRRRSAATGGDAKSAQVRRAMRQLDRARRRRRGGSIRGQGQGGDLDSGRESGLGSDSGGAS
jgi:hypothetical protein